jgi:hypothetical protein
VKPRWKSEDELETRLRASREKPPAECVHSIVSRLDGPGHAQRNRITLAVAFTAAAVGAFGAFGGLSYAARAVHLAPAVSSAKTATQDVQASQAAVRGTQSQTRASSSIFSLLSKSPATNQYEGKSTICHRTGSKTNPEVVITVSNNGLPAHKAHGDTLVNSTAPYCPGPSIP